MPDPTVRRRRRVRLGHIQYLRGIAAMTVVVYHAMAHRPDVFSPFPTGISACPG